MTAMTHHNFRLDADTLAAIDARTAARGGRSATLRRMLARYIYMVAQSDPRLSPDELHTIAEVLRGRDNDHMTISWLASALIDRVGEGDLSRKVLALSYVERVALVDVVERRLAAEHAKVER